MKYLVIISFICFLAITNTFGQTKIDTLLQLLENNRETTTRLGILDTLTEAMVRAEHPEQTKYLKETIKLAKSLEDYDLAVMKTRYIAQSYIWGNKNDSTLQVIEHLLHDKSRFKKEKSEAHLLLKRAAVYYNQEKLKKAIVDYDKAATIFLSTGDTIYAADARFYGGQVYTDLRNFVTGVNRFEEAHNLYNISGDTEYANYATGALIDLYQRNGFDEKAILEREKQIVIAKKEDNHLQTGLFIYKLVSAHFNLGQHELQKKYTDEATTFLEKIPESANKRTLELYLEESYAEYYLSKNELQKAKQQNVSLGLRTLLERARILGANLDIDSDTNKGTVISLNIPVTI